MSLQWGCGRCWNLPVIGSVACVGKAERGEGRGRVGVPLYVPYPDADPCNPFVLELGEQCQALFRRTTRCHRAEAGFGTGSANVLVGRSVRRCRRGRRRPCAGPWPVLGVPELLTESILLDALKKLP
jgi:hypothetical protein